MRTFRLPRVVFSVCRVLMRLVALTLPLKVKKRKRLVLWKKVVASCVDARLRGLRTKTRVLAATTAYIRRAVLQVFSAVAVPRDNYHSNL